VLIDNENRACLADFGFEDTCITIGIEEESTMGVLWEAIYVAPELRKSKLANHRPSPKKPVDVYALGVLIYGVFSCVLYSTMARAQ
jgi:serine/threonine protein kinase